MRVVIEALGSRSRVDILRLFRCIRRLCPSERLNEATLRMFKSSGADWGCEVNDDTGRGQGQQAEGKSWGRRVDRGSWAWTVRYRKALE